MEGDVSHDSAGFGPVVGKDIMFGEATSLASFFEHAPLDGILGLAFKDLSADRITPVFEQLFNQKLITENSFGFYLTDKAGAEGSRLFIGEPNENYFTAPLLWIDIHDDSYWNLTLEGIQVGGKTVNDSYGLYSIMDSGTSLIAINSRIYDKMNIKDVPSDCHSINYGDYPEIGLKLGGRVFTLTPEQWIISEDNGVHCTSGIVGNNMGKIDAIIGDTFMKYYYTHFDYTKKRVGIAKAIDHDLAMDILDN